MATHVVTGATRGIGREIADRLRDDDLVLVGRDADALDELAGSLPSATIIVLDLEHPETFAGVVTDLPDRVDGLVHCAGISARVRVEDSDPAGYVRMFAVNVVAVAELTRLLLPALRAAAGTVVLVNSGQGLATAPASTAYAGSKHALRSFADGLRLEEPLIRVSSVYPGRVATQMQRELREQEGGAYEPERYLDPGTVAQVVVDALRLPADAVPSDVRLLPRHP